MDDPIHMVTFARVVEANSFATAAKRLGVTTSVASKHVAKLEKSLGARLINRSTRKLSLTEAGSTFYGYCVHMIEEIEASERAIADAQAEPRGLLRISGPPSMFNLHVAPALSRFHARHPHIALEIDLGIRAVDLVEEGYDLALRITREPAPDLASQLIAPMRLGWFASPAYLHRHGVPNEPSDLANHECLVFSLEPHPEAWTFQREGRTFQVPVRSTFRCNVLEPLHAMAMHGLGIAQLPTFMAGEEANRGRLVQVLAGWRGEDPGAIHAVWPLRRGESRRVRLFVDFLREHIGEEPYWDRALREAART